MTIVRSHRARDKLVRVDGAELAAVDAALSKSPGIRRGVDPRSKNASTTWLAPLWVGSHAWLPDARGVCGIAVCAICGNDYDKEMEITLGG